MKTILTNGALGFAVLLIAGCVSTKPLPSGLQTKAYSGKDVRILTIRLTRSDSGLLVSGYLAKGIGDVGSSMRHLDVEIQTPTGAILAKTATTFSPNPIPNSRFGPQNSTYRALFPNIPPPNSTILVSVHATSFAKCQLPKAS